MKKSTKIILAVVAVIVVAIIAVVIIFAVLNKEKTPITLETFINMMQSKEYVTVDAKTQFAAYDYIEQVFIAAPGDYKYQIEFYKLSDETNAANFYSNNKSIFESSKTGSVQAETNVSGKNYSKYTLSTNGKYCVVSRIGDTVIYLNVDDQYRDTIKDILKELGY